MVQVLSLLFLMLTQTHALLNSSLEGFHSFLPGFLSSGPVLSLQTLPRASLNEHLMCSSPLWDSSMPPCDPLDTTLAYQAVWPHSLILDPEQQPLAVPLCLPTAGPLPILPDSTHISDLKKLFLTFPGPPKCLERVSFLKVISHFNYLLPDRCLVLFVQWLLCDRAAIRAICMHCFMLLSECPARRCSSQWVRGWISAVAGLAEACIQRVQEPEFNPRSVQPYFCIFSALAPHYKPLGSTGHGDDQSKRQTFVRLLWSVHGGETGTLV